MTDSYVAIFFDWPEMTAALNDQEKGRLIDAIVLYARGDSGWKERIKGNERFVFPIFRAQIDRNRKAREEKAIQDRENGKKGGRPRKHPPASEKPQGFENNPPVVSETLYNNNQNHESNHEYEYDHDIRVPEEEDETINPSQWAVRARIVSAWQRDFGRTLTPAGARIIAWWAERFGYGDGGFIEEAVSAAAMRNANDPVAYVIALFKDWNQRGIREAEEIE